VKKVLGWHPPGGDTRVKSISDSDEQKMVVSFFQEKIGVTPLVAAPGVTHPSDATGRHHH